MGHRLLVPRSIKRLPVFVLPLLLLACLAGCAKPVLTQPGAGSDFLAKRLPEAIRVMSFNVGWDSIFVDDDPMNDAWRRDSKPDEFVRIIQAIHPDVICLQEINPARDPQQIGDILDSALPLSGGQEWHTHSGGDSVIAARFDLTMLADRLGQSASMTGVGQAAALVDLPDDAYEQDLYLLCAHFRAQGGEANIAARQEQADGVMQWLEDAKRLGGNIDLPVDTPIILLGDFNVYDTDPAYHLTTLLTGDIVNEDRYGADIEPDWDGTPLADAQPRHNGSGPDTWTWRDDTQAYNPGALDRVLYTDSTISIEHAFVLNTAIMTAAELKDAGLEAGDVLLDPGTGRYDHLPVVVDVVVGAVQE